MNERAEPGSVSPAGPQAGQYPTFALHSLGWKSFQDLCLSVLGVVLGQTVQAFASVRDGGRDGAFHGAWDTAAAPGNAGSFTLQCKFTSRAAAQMTLDDLDEDLVKAERLAAEGKADNYLILTNMGLTGPNEETIRTRFLQIHGLKNCTLFGAEWLTLKIRENPKLRMMVPRVYGLGDLSTILDERAYSQAKAILDAMGGDLAKFVITDAYRRSAKALQDHGFVLLLGEPASGKSSIAAALSLGAVDLWGCSTMKLTNAQGFTEHWNPNEPRQFFWVDDAFGPSHYQREKVDGWNDVLPHVAAAVRAGARALFTSRDYVYRQAKGDIRMSAFRLLGEAQVTIEVEKLTKQEREQILYNHIKLGDQDRAFRRSVKPFLPTAAASPKFLPETARRLGNKLFTKNLRLDPQGVSTFVEKPVDFLTEVLRGLDEDCFAALALVFNRGSVLESPLDLSREDEDTLTLMGSSVAGVRNSLNALRGTLVELRTQGTSSYWAFRHPTIGDAVATLVSEDPELLDVYLAGASVDRILQEVSCGDVGIEGVKIVIPESRFDAFSRRLDTVTAVRRVQSFLSRRCSREFLSYYLAGRDVLSKALMTVSSNLGIVPSVALLSRLHEYGLLPEDSRLQFVEKASDLAVHTPDADVFVEPSVRRLFTDTEITELRKRLVKDLLPDVEAIVEEWGDNWNRSEDPQDYFQNLIDAFQTFSDQLGAEPIHSLAFSRAAKIARRTADDLGQEYGSEEPDYESVSGSYSAGFSGMQERSVFDDIDL